MSSNLVISQSFKVTIAMPFNLSKLVRFLLPDKFIILRFLMLKLDKSIILL